MLAEGPGEEMVAEALRFNKLSIFVGIIMLGSGMYIIFEEEEVRGKTENTKKTFKYFSFPLFIFFIFS